jgi:hypothetical protein
MSVASRSFLRPDQVQFFDDHGYLILRQWITGPLLERLQIAGDRWIAEGLASGRRDDDYAFAPREDGEVFFRVNYLHEKGDPVSLALLGDPRVLEVAESLCGPNFVPTYESMVFKMAGDGEAIRWHKDAVHSRQWRVFNFDLYLDESRKGAGALRVIPGSQVETIDMCHLEQDHGWDHPDAIDVEMEPGDVLLHDTMVVHGSARALGNRLRRTIYYEFRAAEMIRAEGPWDEEWVRRRMALVPLGIHQHALDFPNSESYDWRPEPGLRVELTEADKASLKVPHVVHTQGAFCSATSPLA